MKVNIDFSSIRTIRIHKEQFNAISEKADAILVNCKEDGRTIAFKRIDDTEDLDSE